MQTSYSMYPPIGIHGQKIEAYPSAIETGLATNEVIQVGVIAVYDVIGPNAYDGKSVKAPATTGAVTNALLVAGLTMWDPTYPEPPYRLGASLPVMRKGRMAIIAETALTAHLNPFVRFAAAAAPGSLLGSLRNDDDGGKAVAAPYLTVVIGAAIGGVAIIEIDI